MIYLMISVLMFCIGLLCFVLGYIGRYELIKSGYLDQAELTNITNEKNSLDEKVEEADKILGELNKFSTYISSELEEKHKELLFLYQLISDKEEKIKKNQENNKNEEIIEDKGEIVNNINIDENKNKEKAKIAIEEFKQDMENKEDDEKTNYTTINEELKIKNILKLNKSIKEKVQLLYQEGKNIPEIAQILKKGKNEVRLMIDIEKKE